MSASESRRQFLAWMRTNFPQVYNASVVPVVERHLKSQTMSGLGDLDTGDDLSYLMATPDLQVSSSDSSPSIWDSISNSAGSLFDTILGTAAKVAPAYVNTSAQLQLLQINSDRAKQGLPPLTYLNGQQVTAAGLAPANPSVNGIETALSTIPSTWMWIGIFGLGGIFLIKALKGSKRR